MKKIFAFPFVTLFLFSSVFAQTSDWPNKTVKIVVPFTSGGALDLTARELAKRLSAKYNQSFIVENLPGAGGTLGVNSVVKSKPDGYTLLVASTGQLSLQPAIFKNLPYDPATDLKPISQLTSAPFILVVSSDFPGKTAKDLSVELKANPKKYNYSSTGNGTLVHLTGEMFSQASGANATHISYKGGPDSVLAVASKDALYTITNISNARPLLSSGKLKALATSGSKRPSGLAEIPTIAENGFPNFDSTVWVGLFGPKNLPSNIVTSLNEATREALADPGFVSKMTANGDDPTPKSPDEFSQFIAKETTKWGAIARSANVQME